MKDFLPGIKKLNYYFKHLKLINYVFRNYQKRRLLSH